MKDKSQQLFSTKRAAEQLGVTDSRIRQICRAHDIGTFYGRDRLLTAAEIRHIKNIPDKRIKLVDRG